MSREHVAISKSSLIDERGVGDRESESDDVVSRTLNARAGERGVRLENLSGIPSNPKNVIVLKGKGSASFAFST